jgi:hypothetical protein
VPKESVFCLAPSPDLASKIIDRVKISGFSNNDVSALFPALDIHRDLPHEKSSGTHDGEHPSKPHRVAWSAARRSGFASIGALVLPGVGHLVAAGPIIFLLKDSVVSSGGGLAGALIAMGISESDASRYESKIKEGNILISVHVEDPENVTLAKTIFREAGAHSICASDGSSLKDGSAIPHGRDLPGPLEAAPRPTGTADSGTLP